MWRGLVVLALLTLSGCVTTYEYYGSDRYGERDAYANAPSGYGDYYAGVGSYGATTWIDYPYYYSVLWPLQRGYVDPFWHPSFYYGVTYFPRDYFSVSLYYSRPYGSLWYSPYRLAWVDSYYDWYPWYYHYPRHRHGYSAPRYGNARNEAERLAHWRATQPVPQWRRDGGSPRREYGDGRSRDAVEARQESLRGADYRDRGRWREAPQVGGFGAAPAQPRRADPIDAGPRSRAADLNGIPYPYRQDRPERSTLEPRAADYGDGRRTVLPEPGWREPRDRRVPETARFGREGLSYPSAPRPQPGYVPTPRERVVPSPERYRREAPIYQAAPRPESDYAPASREWPSATARGADYGPAPAARPERYSERSSMPRFESIAPRPSTPTFEPRPEPSHAAPERPRFERETRDEPRVNRELRSEIGEYREP